MSVYCGHGQPGWGQEALNFAQSRHQFDEITGAVAAVQLLGQNSVPSVLHRAIGARQGEDIRSARYDGAGAGLDRAGADSVVAKPAEQLAKSGNIPSAAGLAQAVERLWRNIASGKASAAGGDHCVNRLVIDPSGQFFDYQLGGVTHDVPRCQLVSGGLDPFDQNIARGIVR